MALPATKNISRDRLTLARQALDGPTEAQLNQAGGGGGAQVITDSMKDMGTVPDEIASAVTGPEPTILTGEPGAGGGGTTYSSDAEMPDENGEGGVTGEMEGGVTSGDFDEAAADFNWSLLDQALQGVDTSEEEAQMQAQQDRMMGRALMDQRASMGASGFGESGAMMAMEGDTRSDAARELGLDISGLRREEAQQAIENALAAQGMDIAKMSATEQAALNDLIVKMMMGGESDPQSQLPGTEDEREENVNSQAGDTPGYAPPDEETSAMTGDDVMKIPSLPGSVSAYDLNHDGWTTTYAEGSDGVMHVIYTSPDGERYRS